VKDTSVHERFRSPESLPLLAEFILADADLLIYIMSLTSDKQRHWAQYGDSEGASAQKSLKLLSDSSLGVVRNLF
jgi:hypothetical protein